MSAEKIHPSLDGLRVSIESLVLDPANARKHGERSIAAIRSSLRRFGQRKPVVVQKEGMVVRAGNGLVEAAKEEGWTEVAAVVVDESSMDATAFAITDNRSAETSEWDEVTLRELLRELANLEVEVPEGLWTDAELSDLLELPELPEGEQREDPRSGSGSGGGESEVCVEILCSRKTYEAKLRKIVEGWADDDGIEVNVS